MSVLFALVRSNYLNYWLLITYFTRPFGMYTHIHYTLVFNQCYNLVNFIYCIYFFSLVWKNISSILGGHKEKPLGGYLIAVGLKNTPKIPWTPSFFLHLYISLSPCLCEWVIMMPSRNKVTCSNFAS